jgi:hypothetical protein
MTQAQQFRIKAKYFFVLLFIIAVLFLLKVSAQKQIFNLSGEVLDQQKAIILNAEIFLIDASGRERKTFTNNLGIFHFENLTGGKYKLKISAEGFAEYEEELELNPVEETPQLKIVLFPTIREEVAVTPSLETPLDTNRAAGTLVLTEKDLQDLPDDPEQLNQQLQQMAASGGGIPGEANVTVDGFLNNGRLPSKSSISQVRINPNLYSAEYDTPPFRGGRIEIITKPGAEAFHGSGFFNFNDTFLNARDPFSIKRAVTNTRRYGFNVGAPIIKNKSGFFLDFEKRDIDEAQIVNALILDELFQPANFVFNSPNPQRLITGAARADWQANQNNVLIFRFDSSRNRLDGQGIGGISLPERGFDYELTENSLRLTETAVLSPKSVNEFRFGLTFRKIEQKAVSNVPAIVVAGSFSSGGANMQELSRSERILEISDYLTLDAGKHSLKFGVQIFNRNFGELRAENTNGTFFFGGGASGSGANQTVISSLEQYRRTLLNLPSGVPTRFSLTIGAPQVSVNQWLLAGFVQDEWRVHPKVLLSLGFRYEAQTAPTDWTGFAPRVGIAYTPDKEQKWVFRARAGVFYERIAETRSLETERLDGERQRQIIINSPSFPIPFLNGNAVNAIPTVRIFDPSLHTPASLQMRLEMERQLPKGWKVSASHSWTKGWAQMRSRNINAPQVGFLNPDPLTAPRPFGYDGNILQFESSGQLKGRVLYVGVNQNSLRLFSLNAGYLNFDFKTDADGDFALPQSSYDFTGEWARPFWQTRHLLFVSASTDLPWKVRLFASLNANSGRPFNITTGRDNNGDGNFNDRPGVTTADDPQAIATRFGFLNPNVINGNLPRNAGTNPWSATLNLNFSRTFNIGKKNGKGESPFRLTANVRANNILNRSNLSGVSGVLTSPLFGLPTTASPARRIEFGLRFTF